MLLVILKTKKLLERFTKKNCQIESKKEFKVEKVIKRKDNKLYVKWNCYDSSFNSWISKKDIDSINEWIFPEPKSLRGRVNVELDLSNYATKTDLENAKGDDLWKFAKKVDLANLNSNVDKLDIDKLKNVPTNLSNLESKVDKSDVDKLVPVLLI